MVRTATSFVARECITVVVFHRDPLLRLGLLASLREDARFDLHAADSLDELVQRRASARGECIAVCDYEQGVAAAGHRVRGLGKIQVMVVTPREREADVQGALAGGVQGYLMVGCRPEEVIDGVVALSRGQRFLSASAARRVADRLGHDALTPREDEVLRIVAAGLSNKMVAHRLGVTEGTVKCHVKAILGKLAVRTRTEAASVAIRRGLVLPS